jgi:hypothetical protein
VVPARNEAQSLPETLRAPALPLIAVLYAAMTADSARRHYSGSAVSWRGRAAAQV